MKPGHGPPEPACPLRHPACEIAPKHDPTQMECMLLVPRRTLFLFGGVTFHAN